MLRYSRSAIDLAYLLVTSTSRDLRKSHLNNLLRLYYDSLENFLNAFDFKALQSQYEFEDLVGDFDECYIFGFLMGVGHAQVPYKT